MFAELPAEVQRQARRAYRIFRQNPNQPSLRFKPIHPTRPIYSVRVSPDYRAVGILQSDEIVLRYLQKHFSFKQPRQPSHRRLILHAAKTFHFVLPLGQIAVRAIAGVSRAAQGFVGLAAHIDVG